MFRFRSIDFGISGSWTWVAISFVYIPPRYECRGFKLRVLILLPKMLQDLMRVSYIYIYILMIIDAKIPKLLLSSKFFALSHP